jgi:negative regulator of flagellin synthesis FlgM
MVADIKGPSGNLAAGAAYRPAGTEMQTDALQRRPAEEAANANDSVTLTGTASQLQALERAVAEVPEVDGERVSEVREAVADGTYRIDNERLASRLMRFEVMMSMGAQHQ